MYPGWSCSVGAWWVPCVLDVRWVVFRCGGRFLPPMAGAGRPRPAGQISPSEVRVGIR